MYISLVFMIVFFTAKFQMNIFLQSLTHVPVGFTMYGLFILTKESTLTVSIAQGNQLLQ